MANTFRIMFEIDAPQFDYHRDMEIGIIIRRVAEMMEHTGQSCGNITDDNGNRIGDFGIKLADDKTMP